MKKNDKSAKPLITAEELEEFKERLEATVELGMTHGIMFASTGQTLFNPLDVSLVMSTERLDKSSRRLNVLTKILIALTFVLIVVGIVTVVVMLNTD
jgi:hypothetical protein